MTQNQSATQSYLAESVFGQKAGTKPGGQCSGERSQRQTAMPGDEEASPRYSAGSRLGRGRGRVCAPVTKPVAPSLWVRPHAAYTVSRVAFASVKREVMRGKWHSHRTGEVPSCPDLGRVMGDHKAPPKSRPYARGPGTSSQRPWSWGCQQSHSRPAPLPAVRAQRQNLRESGDPDRDTGKVSDVDSGHSMAGPDLLRSTRHPAKKHSPIPGRWARDSSVT